MRHTRDREMELRGGSMEREESEAARMLRLQREHQAMSGKQELSTRGKIVVAMGAICVGILVIALYAAEPSTQSSDASVAASEAADAASGAADAASDAAVAANGAASEAAAAGDGAAAAETVPEPTARDANASWPGEVDVSAEDLSRAFQDNEVRALRNYGNAALKVTGIVRSISMTSTDGPDVQLKGIDGFLYTLTDVNAFGLPVEDVSSLSKGDTVVLKCNGVGAMAMGSPEIGNCKMLASYPVAQ